MILFIVGCQTSEPIDHVFIKVRAKGRTLFGQEIDTGWQWVNCPVYEKNGDFWRVKICIEDNCTVRWVDITELKVKEAD